MFNKLKTLFGITSFKGNALLKDGTELVIEGDVAVGVAVSIVTPDGNKPLTAGNYELENGTLITVDDKGIITDIKEPETKPAEEVPVEEAEQPAPAPEQPKATVEEQVAKLEERLTKLEETIASITKQESELKQDKEELSKQIKGFEEKLSKMDGASPLKKHNNVAEQDDIFNLSPVTTSRMKALGLKNN